MSDLFSAGQEVRDNSEEVRNAAGVLLGDPKGKRKSGSAGLSLPDKSGKSGRTSFSLYGPRGANLRDIRDSLETELAQANASVEAAKHLADPLEAAFRSAHSSLEQLHTLRAGGRPVQRATMFAAYDARMYAGHAWHPFRTKLTDALNWRRVVLERLSDANRELGV